MIKFDVKPDPDFSRLESVFRRDGETDRAVIFELFSNLEDEVLDYFEVDAPRGGYADLSEMDFLKRHIAYNYHLGYDFINVWCRRDMNFVGKSVAAVGEDGRVRNFEQSGLAVIETQKDLESYPWPDMANGDYSMLERVRPMLPEGMKVVTGYPGILQTVMGLLGYEGMSFKLFEDPELVAEVFREVGSRITKHLEICSQYDTVGVVQLGDDLGFCTQTLFPPDTYREHVFPWYKKANEIIHAAGKFSFLHSCGNRELIMDDLIECGWDGIHSFEDKILPIYEFKAQWGGMVAAFGGFDMHKITTFTEEQVREHTRFLIEKCGRCGWALGTGNSVANDIPVENFLAMIDEAFKVW